jgi:hypothetical protein
MRHILTLALFCLLAACGRQDVINKAKADFQARNPQWKIVKAYLGEGDADHAYVHVRYVHTPATAFPPRPLLLEMEMGYRRTGDEWVLFHEAGSRYIKPAHRFPDRRRASPIAELEVISRLPHVTRRTKTNPMTPKIFLLTFAAVGITPAVLWALVSLATSAFSLFVRPVSLSFRLYSRAGRGIGAFEFHELPPLTSLSILAGATLLIFGIVSISRTH